VGDDGGVRAEELLRQVVVLRLNRRVAFPRGLEERIDGELAFAFAALFSHVHQETVTHEVTPAGRRRIGASARCREPEVVLEWTSAVTRRKSPLIFHQSRERHIGVLLHDGPLECKQVRCVDIGREMGKGRHDTRRMPLELSVTGDADADLVLGRVLHAAPFRDVLNRVRANTVFSANVGVGADQPAR